MWECIDQLIFSQHPCIYLHEWHWRFTQNLHAWSSSHVQLSRCRWADQQSIRAEVSRWILSLCPWFENRQINKAETSYKHCFYSEGIYSCVVWDSTKQSSNIKLPSGGDCNSLHHTLLSWHGALSSFNTAAASWRHFFCFSFTWFTVTFSCDFCFLCSNDCNLKWSKAPGVDRRGFIRAAKSFKETEN